MTLPEERYHSLRGMRERLVRLAATPGRVTKRQLRDEIRAALRHYPLPFEIELLALACPLLLSGDAKVRREIKQLQRSKKRHA